MIPLGLTLLPIWLLQAAALGTPTEPLRLDPTITTGELLQLAGLVATIFGAYYALRGRLQFVADKLVEITDKVNDHDQRLDRHYQNLADLNAEVFTEHRGRRRGDHHGEA